ncbi:unnamed protein product, partial [Iphiclides podalirius]
MSPRDRTARIETFTFAGEAPRPPGEHRCAYFRGACRRGRTPLLFLQRVFDKAKATVHCCTGAHAESTMTI